MNTLLLIFFALPLAVIIISIALQKILKCPFLVAAIIFAIFLIVAFVIGNLIILVAAIAYTLLSFVTAVLTEIICRLLHEFDKKCCGRERCICSNSNSCINRNNGTQLLSISGCCSNSDDNNDNGNLLTISSNGCNGVENELLTINTNCSRNNSNNNNHCSCNCNTSNDSIAVRANVFPNSNTNGRSGSFCGCFRKRSS